MAGFRKLYVTHTWCIQCAYKGCCKYRMYCSADNSYTISQPAQLAATVTKTDVTCKGATRNNYYQFPIGRLRNIPVFS